MPRPASLALAAMLGALPVMAEPDPTPRTGAETMTTSPFDLTLTAIDNQPLAMEAYRGHPILVVNTASMCGYTPQYKGLQALWTEYGPKGLIVIGVPSDNFGGQEYADNAKIAEFCELNFGVSFPLTARADVKGQNAHPLFMMARETLGEAAVPGWNFHKILFDAEGVPVAAFPSRVTPSDAQLIGAIEAVLVPAAG